MVIRVSSASMIFSSSPSPRLRPAFPQGVAQSAEPGRDQRQRGERDTRESQRALPRHAPSSSVILSIPQQGIQERGQARSEAELPREPDTFAQGPWCRAPNRIPGPRGGRDRSPPDKLSAPPVGGARL